jgi:hypothetical protein
MPRAATRRIEFFGYGVAFNLQSQSFDFKVETYHNEHEDGSSFGLTRELTYDQWYRCKVSIHGEDNDEVAVVRPFIDYDLDGTWTEAARSAISARGIGATTSMRSTRGFARTRAMPSDSSCAMHR